MANDKQQILTGKTFLCASKVVDFFLEVLNRDGLANLPMSLPASSMTVLSVSMAVPRTGISASIH